MLRLAKIRIQLFGACRFARFMSNAFLDAKADGFAVDIEKGDHGLKFCNWRRRIPTGAMYRSGFGLRRRSLQGPAEALGSPDQLVGQEQRSLQRGKRWI
jgi:hypothetical protein